jgi:prepilin signal peptidase PulO-like enzyme (type II secretory pathway)
MEIIFSIIGGLVIGSFLNVIIHRLYAGGSVLLGRSHCVHCKKELAAYDLIPVISFFLLRGRCRNCKKKISWQYPIVELITAVVFILFALNTKYSILNTEVAFSLFFACSFIVIAVFDWKHYLILDKVIFPLIGLAAVFSVIRDIANHSFGLNGHFIPGLLAGLGLVLFFGFQYFVSQGRWIGFGDVKFGFLLGMVLGWPLSLCMLMMAYFSGAIIGVMLIALGKKEISSQVPFGTFLGFSAIITMLYGEQITNWYLRLIGF